MRQSRIKAYEKIFKEHTRSGTPTSVLARRAGVSVSNYYYWRNKRGNGNTNEVKRRVDQAPVVNTETTTLLDRQVLALREQNTQLKAKLEKLAKIITDLV